MTIRSYTPLLSIPTGCWFLFGAASDIVAGRIALDASIIFTVLQATLGLYWVVSGVIKISHPYVMTDGESVRVFGHDFSNRVSLEIPWRDIVGSQGRTFTNILVKLRDGRVLKIPINGMGPASLTAFLTLIDARRGDANHGVQATR